MKKHNNDLLYAEANQRQRFSIRKLSIGAASVLLGTVFYLGGNASVTHAEEKVESQQAQKIENGGVASPASTEATTDSVNSAPQGNVDSHSNTENGTKDNNSNVATQATSEIPEKVTKGLESSTPKELSTDNNETQHFSPTEHKVPMPVQALAESKVDSQTKQTKISYVENGESKDSVTVNTGNTVQINFQTNDYEAGDKFTFKIHPKSTEGDIDITTDSGHNPYTITPANDKPNQALVSEVQSNKNEYEFTDTMKGAGTYSQIIAIKTSDYFKADKVYKDGTYEIAIDVYKNDDIKPFTTSTFKQVINHYQSISWPYNPSSDSLHNIYTMDDQWVSNGTILPDTDYKWKLNIDINPFYNQETQVTIPVPDNFTLNQNETNTNSDNLKWLDNYHATISQNGNNLIINFPKLTDDQVKELNNISTAYSQTLSTYIIGKIGQYPAETTTVSGKDSIKMEYNLGNNQKTSSDYPLQAIILGTNNPVDNTPIGNLFSGNIDPDKHNKMHDYYPEQPEKITTKEDSKQGIHALNNNVSLSSTSAKVINDIDATVIVPDGMNISSIANEISSDSNPTFQYEYLDGTKSDTFTQDKILTAPSGKFIKNIHVHIDKANPYHQLFNIKLMGVLADEYRGDNDETASKNSDQNQPAKYDKVSNLDSLTTKIKVTLADSDTNSNHAASIWSAGQIVLDKNPDTTIHLNQHYATGKQTDQQAGHKGGTISIEPYDFQNEVPNNTFYVVLPENALLDPDTPFTDLPKDAKVSYLNINNRNIVKIQINSGKREDYAYKTFTLNLDNSSVVTNKTLESNYHVYVAIPNGQKEYYYYSKHSTKSPITSSDFLPLVENNPNAYSLTDGNWTLVTSVVTQTTTQSKGNQNSDFTSVGKSDDKGSADMSFSSSIINGEPTDLENVTTILRMPNTTKDGKFGDGKSEFNFQLKNPIKVINVTDGNKEVTDGIQILYTTETSYKTKAMKEISTSDWQNDFTSTVPTELSKVTAVAVKIAKIPPQYLYRIVAEGIDPTLAIDAGKTAYVANKIWGDHLLEKNVEVGKEANDKDQSVSAKISVSGQSTIHVKLHYKDANGTDQYIPVDDLTLKDNEDTLTKDAVLKNSFGIDAETLKKYGITKDNINNINDNEDFRKELIKKYPTLANYAIDFSNPSDPSKDPENKGKHGYANNAKDNAAGWGKVAQYYFDGDQIVFELTKLQDMSQSIHFNRQTDYISNATGKQIKPQFNESNIAQNSFKAIYDPLTKNLVNNFSYYAYKSPNNILGYSLESNDKTLVGPSYIDINKIINDNKDQLLSPKNNIGMKVDITKDSKGYHSTISEDKRLPKDTISVVYHQTAHYAPSHANLITMVPGQNNELTAIANNIDQDGNANKDINFGVTDEQLAKTGYTYKVYYVPNSYEGQLNDAITNNDYEYLTTAWLNDNDSYDNLAAALVDHPEFDDAWDDGSDANEHNNGSAEFARLNSQNFVVVYTPINQRPQEVYITSDNDPFAYNNLLKDYAMPKAIVSDKALQQKLIDQIKQQMKDEDADQESLQHLLNLAEAGHFDYIYKMSGKAGQLPILSVEDIHSFNSYGTLPNTDISNPETGEVTPLYPHLDQNNSNMVDATIQTNLYTRNGHYIQQVTLSSADGSGKKIVLTHTFDPNKNPEQTDSDTTGDAALLQLLNYLTNQTPGDAGFSYQISNVDNGWKISVDGLPNSAVVTDEDGNKFININNADRFIYNDTDYNADQSSDPNPQIINFHYATISPENSEDQQNKVTIHYIDVTGVEPMDINQAKEDYGFNFAPGTKYSQQVNAGNELTDIPGYDDNRSGVVSAISKDFTFDNTAKDNEILKALADQGYYLVQRDRETTGQHPFDIYASDQSTGEYNGNYPAYYTGSSSEQNYYVYLKKGRKVNYQVILEDKNGQQMKVLTGSTLLGYGDPTDKIATTPIGQDHTVDTDTIGKKYDAIMEGLKKQYPNYTLVVTGNPNSKLTVSDEIGTDETFGDKDNDLTKTIYMVPKYGNVTVHYVDVDKAAENLKPTDGKTIDNNEHNFTFNGHVGDDFSSNLWQYPDDWEFVTQSPEIKGHTLTNQIPSDLYVYLKHKHTPIKQTKTVNETINYVDQDGNPLPKNVKDTTKRTITFKTTDDSYHDEVTGDDHIVWTPEGDFTKNGDQIQFGTADTGVEGYDLDKDATKNDKSNPTDVLTGENVSAVTVDLSKELKDITLTIHYNKQYETHIHYIDVNDSEKTSGYKPEDGKAIDNNSHNVDHNNGHINDPIFPNNKTPWNFADAGWILAETPSTSVTKEMTLTKDTPKDIYIYLKHDTTKPFNKDMPGTTPIHVTETIHYVDEAGHPVADKNGNTTAESTKTITLTPQGYFDKVKGKNVVTGWTTKDGNEFPTFAIPEFDDFFAISANHTDQNNSKVDDFDKDNKQVKPVSYYATDDDQNIDVTVVLKKKHSELQHNKPMKVTETVHYVDENGNPVKSDDKVEMTLTPEGYHDNQTNEDVITGWTSSLDNSEFPTHSTHVDGYDIDMTKTKASDVSDDHSEVKAVKVTVEDNQQPANVKITIHYTKQAGSTIIPPDGGDNNDNGGNPEPNPDPEKPTPDKPNNSIPPTPSDDGGKKTPEDKPQTPSTEKHEDGKTPNKKHSNNPSHKNKNSKKTHPNKSSKTAPVAHEKNNKKSRDNKRWSQTASTHAQNLDANSKKKHVTTSNMSPLSENYTRAKKYNIGTNADKRQALPQTGEKANELGLLGLGLASLAALISLAGDKKRKN
ncbi:hypothetical protein FC39_GL001729 [Lactobacillus hamsteri DSM 5661 = JCM 6256]|uniref:Gram-positive cocci surface proteins LPxTG domain-containing protein n=1 Tax=Lactobacillus hamsteri DSM 5661 = JCM 6256 TaxID=1423754 RepID=A0A0R1Y5Y1_9LACO|nr:YSIRK signal domain/LPXTG anchor domain surface protein [Lactobacillus hamsteri]KRM37815.1 hypothetical protein FC39_GL001729 [Lactobacillus hamsteri DSM 5661 = JCM 6256]